MRRMQIPWWSPAFLTLLGSLLLNFFLLVCLFIFRTEVVFVPVEKDRSWLTQFPWSALVTAIAVVAGFGSFFLQKYQKDAHFAYGILEERLKDTLDRFTDPESDFRRASAAVRLYEMCFSSTDKRVVAGYDWHPKDIERAAVTQLISGLVFEKNSLVEDEIFLNLMRLARELPANSELMDHMRLQSISYNRRLRAEFCRFLVALHKAFPEKDIREFIKEAAIGRFITHYADFESCVLRETAKVENIEPALVAKMKSLSSEENQDVTREVRTTFTKLIRSGDLIAASVRQGKLEAQLDLRGTFTLDLDLRMLSSLNVEFSDAWLLQCHLSETLADRASGQGAIVFQH